MSVSGVGDRAGDNASVPLRMFCFVYPRTMSVTVSGLGRIFISTAGYDGNSRRQVRSSLSRSVFLINHPYVTSVRPPPGHAWRTVATLCVGNGNVLQVLALCACITCREHGTPVAPILRRSTVRPTTHPFWSRDSRLSLAPRSKQTAQISLGCGGIF